MKIISIDIDLLKPTEKTDHENFKQIEKLFANTEIGWPPIYVSQEYFILDGHHRFRLACEMDKNPMYCC